MKRNSFESPSVADLHPPFSLAGLCLEGEAKLRWRTFRLHIAEHRSQTLTRHFVCGLSLKAEAKRWRRARSAQAESAEAAGRRFPLFRSSSLSLEGEG